LPDAPPELHLRSNPFALRSSIALAALAGVVIFHEAFWPLLLQGVALTIMGLAILTRAQPTLRQQQPA
jgi:drug/metabolite transporter (DMT)-like permease